MRMPTITLDDDAWDDLLSFIEERRVIPIVGPELLQVSTDRGPRLLHDWLAEKLAGRLNVDISSLPQPYTLNDVVCWFLAARDALEARARWPVQNDQERRDRAEASIGLALALARQGRAAQALEVINPVVKLRRELAARNHGDQWQQVELASALYVEALCDPVRRAALLKAAATLVNSVPAAMRSLHSVRRWHDRIVLGLREGNAAMAASAVGRSAG